MQADEIQEVTYMTVNVSFDVHLDVVQWDGLVEWDGIDG